MNITGHQIYSKKGYSKRGVPLIFLQCRHCLAKFTADHENYCNGTSTTRL